MRPKTPPSPAPTLAAAPDGRRIIPPLPLSEDALHAGTAPPDGATLPADGLLPGTAVTPSARAPAPPLARSELLALAAASPPFEESDPCAAWSLHAAELAAPLAQQLEGFEETPSTQVLVAEGKLVRLMPGLFLPPDLLTTAVQRALALGCALGEHLQGRHVIAGRSAAWVLLGGQPPEPVELLTPLHRPGPAGVRLRTGRLSTRDVEMLGGAPLTVPGRTATDLLRFTPAYLAVPVLLRLLRGGHVRPEEVRHQLWTVRRHPGVRAARKRFELLLTAVPDAARSPAPSTSLALSPRASQTLVRGAPVPTGLPSAVTR